VIVGVMDGKRKGKKGKGRGGARTEGPVEGGSDDVRTELLRVGVVINVVFTEEALYFESLVQRQRLYRHHF